MFISTITMILASILVCFLPRKYSNRITGNIHKERQIRKGGDKGRWQDLKSYQANLYKVFRVPHVHFYLKYSRSSGMKVISGSGKWDFLKYRANFDWYDCLKESQEVPGVRPMWVARSARECSFHGLFFWAIEHNVFDLLISRGWKEFGRGRWTQGAKGSRPLGRQVVVLMKQIYLYTYLLNFPK